MHAKTPIFSPETLSDFFLLRTFLFLYVTQIRYDQAVSLQHRGLLRYPLTSNIAPLRGRARTRQQGLEAREDVNAPGEDEVQTESGRKLIHGEVSDAKGAEVTSNTTAASASAEGTVAGTEGSSRNRRASVRQPYREPWPDFLAPSQAYARAAPLENPKGLLPPSPRLLSYIHQVRLSM